MSAILSPAVFPAQDGSSKPARQSKAQVSIGGNRCIHEGCHGNVAVSTRNQGRDGTTQVPLTMSGLANAFAEADPGPAYAAGCPAGIFVNRMPLPFAQSRIS
jgi:hypothetical protein